MNKDTRKYIDIYKKIIDKILANANKIGVSSPNAAKDGVKYDCRIPRNWVSGFWPGLLLKAYKATGDDSVLGLIRDCEKRMDEALSQPLTLHHDTGFMWYLSSVVDYKLTGYEENKKRGLIAAIILASRFNPKGNYIRAWNSFGNGVDYTGWVIIDCMINIELLYWASAEIGDSRFKNIANAHAQTVMNNFIRDDGTVRHVVEFDSESGEVKGYHPGQGYSENSAWTRGAGWAIYGFAKAYAYSGNREFIDTAIKCAKTFMTYFNKLGFIPCDFLSPSEPCYHDSSAAAVAACGMLEIAKHLSDDASEEFKGYSLSLIDMLDSKYADYSLDTEPLLKGATHAYNSNQNIGLIYGDYYFAEALENLLQL
ncbi:MAG: glycoside hydrolase family 88 protein [Clostridia bacterium]|nr:glycoside hydrolase family 88 protein [Clostridia bacterium]